MLAQTHQLHIKMTAIAICRISLYQGILYLLKVFPYPVHVISKDLKSASYINGNLNGRKELEHYAS